MNDLDTKVFIEDRKKFNDRTIVVFFKEKYQEDQSQNPQWLPRVGPVVKKFVIGSSEWKQKIALEKRLEEQAKKTTNKKSSSKEKSSLPPMSESEIVAYNRGGIYTY